ncbi:hypothetical protein D9615_010005 [Tricholomella constricta]|uniref:Protein-S-isoprenylcysteine O-methyltransferase n=1 Tax=Tricholomella constricta TaxID=117010 RepID=A0A8H5LVI2_9AGAR|nr:hypothetical protein D9615_010005 [Tricholomella constricta]
MIPFYNVFIASLFVLASYTYWVSCVPPTPPASKVETKRPIPWVRIHGFVIATIICTVLLLSAYRALTNGYIENPLLLPQICSPSLLGNTSIMSPTAYLGCTLLFLGGYLRVAAQRALGKFFTWEISLKADHKLCTSGPYTLVRHPGYLGLWAVRIGGDVLLSSNGTVFRNCLHPHYALVMDIFVWYNYFFTAAIVVWMSYRADWEDGLMKREFDGAWRKWAERTRYRIVPYVY